MSSKLFSFMQYTKTEIRKIKRVFLEIQLQVHWTLDIGPFIRFYHNWGDREGLTEHQSQRSGDPKLLHN